MFCDSKLYNYFEIYELYKITPNKKIISLNYVVQN